MSSKCRWCGRYAKHGIWCSPKCEHEGRAAGQDDLPGGIVRVVAGKDGAKAAQSIGCVLLPICLVLCFMGGIIGVILMSVYG
jgi:hypothetical protein